MFGFIKSYGLSILIAVSFSGVAHAVVAAPPVYSDKAAQSPSATASPTVAVKEESESPSATPSPINEEKRVPGRRASWLEQNFR